jgi:hypothetical protein
MQPDESNLCDVEVGNPGTPAPSVLRTFGAIPH